MCKSSQCNNIKLFNHQLLKINPRAIYEQSHKSNHLLLCGALLKKNTDCWYSKCFVLYKKQHQTLCQQVAAQSRLLLKIESILLDRSDCDITFTSSISRRIWWNSDIIVEDVHYLFLSVHNSHSAVYAGICFMAMAAAESGQLWAIKHFVSR